MISPYAPEASLGLLALGAALAFVTGRLLGARWGDRASALALGLAFVEQVALATRVDAPATFTLGEVALRADAVAVLLGLLATALGAMVAWFHALDPAPGARDRGALVVLCVTGVAGVGLARDLFDLYVFFELMALASFALVALDGGQRAATQALRYLLVNAAGSLLALTGVGASFMASGTLGLGAAPIAAAVPPALAVIAAGLLLVGFGAKAAIAPVHLWLPSTYAEAPPGVSALLGGVVTVTGVFALTKALAGPLALAVGPMLGALLALLAVATMTLGNLSALCQTDVKRVLAYSSLAHGGYVLLAAGLGVAFGVEVALLAAAFHALAHGVLKGGAFLAAGALERAHATRDISSLRGAARASPLAGLALAVFLLGLAGVPPTVGFFGKVLLGAATASGPTAWSVLLVLALAANVVLSLFYYAPLAVTLIARAPPAPPAAATAAATRVPARLLAPALALAAAAVALGLFPQALLALARAAASVLSGGGP